METAFIIGYILIGIMFIMTIVSLFDIPEIISFYINLYKAKREIKRKRNNNNDS